VAPRAFAAHSGGAVEPGSRGRKGSKHHLLVDATGIPLAYTLTGGNRHDVTQLIPLLDRVPAVAGLVGRPRRRPDQVVRDAATTTTSTADSYAPAGSHR
jgi:DDE family transposase